MLLVLGGRWFDLGRGIGGRCCLVGWDEGGMKNK